MILPYYGCSIGKGPLVTLAALGRWGKAVPATESQAGSPLWGNSPWTGSTRGKFTSRCPHLLQA
jgi:hypothetical protein